MNKEQDYNRFCNAIGTLAELYDKDLSEFAIAAYFNTLKEYSIQNVELAISQAMGTLKFWPKPVELIEIITGGAQNNGDCAEIQAHRVLYAVRRIGGYNSVRFDDGATNAVVQQGFGGWPKLCSETTESDSKWFVHDFVRIYQAFKRQGIKYVGHLAGRSEIENAAKGYQFDPPIMIGRDNNYKQLPN